MLKNILVIVAMPEEQNYLVQAMERYSPVKTTHLRSGVLLTQGAINNKNVSVILSGIGKVRAAIATATTIEAVSPDLVINIGVAGGLQVSQNPGDLVIASEVAYHDVDVTVFGYKPGQLPDMPQIYIPDYGFSQKLHRAAVEQEFRSSLGSILSGDQFVSSYEGRERLLAFMPDASAVDMESASIAQTAFLYKLPFVIVRSISDKGDDEASHSYQEFLQISAERAGRVLCRFLETE